VQSTTNLSLLSQKIAPIAVVLLWPWAAAPVLGQSPFSPPPSPQSATAGPSVSTPTTKNRVTPTASSGAQPLEGGQIVARVDGQIVLASDVLWQVNQLIKANQDRIPTEKVEEARQALLRQQVMGLLDTKMLYANFRRQVPAENLPNIEENLEKPFEEQEVPRLIKMLNLNSRSELDALLRESGTSISDVRRQFIERTIAGEWLRQMVPKPKEVTHEAMLNYYSEHKQDFEYTSQAKWEEVMISFARVDDDRTAAWQAITGIGNEVWQRVSKQPSLRGPVFAEIAKQKSHGFTAPTGGGHDWTTQGALRSEAINQALFSLKVGQLSRVIESDRGFHIVRVLDRKEAGCTPFTKAQVTIRQELGKDQRKGLAEVELTKLRKNSRVWTLFDGDLSGPQLSRRRQSDKRR